MRSKANKLDKGLWTFIIEYSNIPNAFITKCFLFCWFFKAKSLFPFYSSCAEVSGSSTQDKVELLIRQTWAILPLTVVFILLHQILKVHISKSKRVMVTKFEQHINHWGVELLKTSLIHTDEVTITRSVGF